MNIWERLSKVVVFLLFVAGIVAVCVWYFPLIKHNERMRQDLYRADLRVTTAEEKSKILGASLNSIKNDPRTVERLARATLGYARPGETVVRFEEPKK